ncbi:hypothetical protein SUDANB178_04360 [Streptomyces sp. enrichment culture]
MVLSAMKGTLKLTAAGEVTPTPDAYTVNARSMDTECAPEETVAKAATIRVTAEGSGTPTTTPTSTPSDTATSTQTATATPTATATGGTGQTDFPGKEVQVPYAPEGLGEAVHGGGAGRRHGALRRTRGPSGPAPPSRSPTSPAPTSPAPTAPRRSPRAC